MSTWSLLEDAARRQLRRARARFAGSRVDVFFHLGYELPESEIADTHRARKIAGHLLAEGWLSSARINAPEPLHAGQLARVHDIAYLQSLDRPEAVARVLGSDSIGRAAAEQYVTAQRWATAGTVEAARRALRSRGRGGVAVNLGGGFHHAHADHGHGFCLFNDVAIAVAELREQGFSGRVLIVDLDLHQGDGTRRIFADDDRVLTCSLHATEWDPLPATQSIDRALGPGIGDATYLATLDEILPEAFDRAAPELVFYVAGVDVAADDRLGNWRLSPHAIMARDRRVFDRAGKIPVVMTLAGGYGEDAWRYSARTLVWLLSGRDEPIAGSVERAMAQFRGIANGLSVAELSGHDDPFRIDEDDIYGPFNGGYRRQRMLGFYTRYGVELAFERYGILPKLRERGYRSFLFDLDPDSSMGERLALRTGDERRDLLIELVVKIIRHHQPYRLLNIEWLLLQDPRREPTPERPLLPGQEHPGLGCLAEMIGMLAMACERLGLDGLSFHPSHYHVAAQARGLLRFLDPADEAYFVALGEVLKPMPLARATRCIEEGGVIDEQGKRIKWRPAPMVFPVSETLKAQLDSDEHAAAVERAARQLHYRKA